MDHPRALTEEKARRAFKRYVPDADRHLAEGSVELVPSREWYLNGGVFSLARVLRAWDAKLEQAAARGYAGMRANGNSGWLETNHWRRFVEYEHALDESLAGKPMIVMCSYALEQCGAAEVLDVARTHRYAIAKRDREWEVVEWRTPLAAPDLYRTLTAREREVLAFAADGDTNPQIAAKRSASAPSRPTGPTHAQARAAQSDRAGPENGQRPARSLTRQRPHPRVLGRGSEPPRRRRPG